MQDKQSSQTAIEVQPPDPPFWTKTSWLQLGYGIWVNMTVMGIGLAFGFPAVTIPQLREESSGIKISLKDEAWIASVLTLSSPIGSLLCGLLMDRYGRRLVLVLCEIPMCFGWFYTGFAATAKDIIIGRVIAGVGLGMAITAPRAYITEITLPNMRGVIGALPNLFISLGLTIQAGFGSFLHWTTLCYICGCYTIIMMVSNVFLPDTPYFLLMKEKASTVSSAKINLRRFRSSKFNVDAELEALYDFRKENNIRSLSLKDQIKALFKPSSYKPYAIATIYICFMQLAGVNVVIMWAVEMLETANTSVDAHLGNFILALTRIVFGLLTSVLLFKVGRRVMAMVSAIGVGFVAIGLCIFLYTIDEKTVIPQFIFMAYIAFATLGYYTLPFLMMFELLPLQIRGLLSGICISQLNLLMFAMNNCYPFIRQKFGLPNTMAMFGVFSLLGALVLYFILPETKNLTLQEIEEYFNSRRSTLISQRRVMSDQLNDASRMTLGMSKSNLNFKRSNEKGKQPKILMSKTNNIQKDPTDEDSVKRANDLKYKEKHLEDIVKDLKDKDKDLKNNERNLDIEQNLEVNGNDFMTNENDLDDNMKDLQDKNKDAKNKERNLMDNKLKLEENGKDLIRNENDLKNEDMDLKDNELIEKQVTEIEKKDLINNENYSNENKIDLKAVEVSKEIELKDEVKEVIDKEGPKDKNDSVETGNDSKDKKSINSDDSKSSKDSRKSRKDAAVIFRNIDD